MTRFPRRPPRLERVFPRDNAPIYFVTFCTYRRGSWLARDPVHRAFIQFGEAAAERFRTGIGRYVIMPDHIHLFVCGGPEFVLGRWIGGLKQALARAAEKPSTGGTPWQEGCFDHLLRNDESMSAKWDYIRENPVRAGLAATAEEWPYQGEIVRLDRA
ncbi:MAG: REP-associated tyrosine transposase [Chthoniobacterales bacterium]